MSAPVLHGPPERRAPLTWLVEELLHQAGRERRVDWLPARETRLALRGETLLEGPELEHLFAVLSLEIEAKAPRDGFGRVDETADLHPAGEPWITARARQLFAPAAASAELTVYLTHDVDRTTGLEPTSLVKAARRTLTGNPGQWLTLPQALDHAHMGRRLEELVDLECSSGVRGIWFMIAGPAGLGRYDSRTDIRWRTARRAARVITERGGFVGLHGSFHAAERNSYREEAERIRRTTGQPVLLHRNHYLRLDTNRFCDQLEQAGIRVDFTLGYTARTGFRNGVCVPFRPWNRAEGRAGRLVAVPLVYMEAPGQQLDPEPMLADLELKLAAAARLGGAVSLLVHPEVFAVDRRWYAVYERIIGLCRRAGARLDHNPESLWTPTTEGEAHGD